MTALPIADEVVDPSRIRYEVTALGKAALAWEEPVSAFEAKTLFAQYVPRLTRIAVNRGVPSDDAESLAIEVLGDVVLRVMATSEPPSDVEPYLVAAINNRVRRWRRDQTKRWAKHEDASEPAASGEERVVAGTCSEYALTASHGPDCPNDDQTQPFIAHLAAMLMRELDDDDESRRLLLLLSASANNGHLASELGLTKGAIRVRRYRLRQRLRAVTPLLLASLDEEERREAKKFLDRAGAPSCCESS